MKIYYAHPMSWYGTNNEFADIMELKRQYPDAEIINPHNPLFEAKVALAKIEGRDVMTIFTDYIRDQADMVVFRAFRDDMVGAGVLQEVLAAHIWGKPVAEIRTLHRSGRASEVYVWKYGYLTFDRALTVTETRQRVKDGTL